MKKLENLSDTELERLARGLKKGLEYRRTHVLESFKAYPKQLEFFAMGAEKRERLYQAGNQFWGKTTAGAVEMAYHLTGLYPDRCAGYPKGWVGRRFNHPVKAWALGESGVWTRDQAQSRLCGEWTSANDVGSPDWGTGFIPKEHLLGRTLAHGTTGAFDTISVRHVPTGGVSACGFKSYEQGRAKVQGASQHVIWPDEVPPDDIYGELMARISFTRGIIFVTFTPMKGATQVTDRFADDDPIALKDRGVVKAGRADIIGHDPEYVESVFASYPTHERAARANGDIMQGEGAVWEGINMSMITVPHIALSTVPPSWPKLWAIDFGIGHPFAAVLMTHDQDADVIYVLHEIRVADALPMHHIAMMRGIAPMPPVAWPRDGTNREKSNGEELYAFYKPRAGQPGMTMMRDFACFPDGSVSTIAGVKEMLARMRTGKFFVSASCTRWFQEANSYHWKDGKIVKKNDDLMSASRIGVMAIRNARPVPLGPGLAGIFPSQVRRQAREVDIFTNQPIP